MPGITENINGIDINLLALIFIIGCASLFLVGLIVRAFKLRFLSRLMFLIGTGCLLGYSSLAFVNLPTNFDWTLRDIAEIILFGSAVLLFLYNLIVFIRKR